MGGKYYSVHMYQNIKRKYFIQTLYKIDIPTLITGLKTMKQKWIYIEIANSTKKDKISFAGFTIYSFIN